MDINSLLEKRVLNMLYIFSSSVIFLVTQLVLSLAGVWKAFLYDPLSENNEAAAI